MGQNNSNSARELAFESRLGDEVEQTGFIGIIVYARGPQDEPKLTFGHNTPRSAPRFPWFSAQSLLHVGRGLCDRARRRRDHRSVQRCGPNPVSRPSLRS